MSARLWSVLTILALAAPAAAQTSNSNAPAADSVAASSDMQQQAPPPPPPAPAVAPTSPDFPRGKISGLAFGDYFWNAVGDPTHVYIGTSDQGKTAIDANGVPITRDLNAFQIRRLYFQLDNDLSIKYSTRFRLEADSKSLTSDGKIGVAVKALYFQARNVYPRGDFYFGVIGTPTFEFAEDVWGYRAIEKTIADFRGIGSSADVGVEAKGFLDGAHRFGYSAMIGNGNGQKPEDNRDKKFYLALPSKVQSWRVEPYVDYENVPAHQDRATYKLLLGYEARVFTLGAEALDRVNHKAGAPNQEPRGVALFGRATMTPTVGAFARVDLWQPDHRATNRLDSQLWIAGIDWQPAKDVHVMPNIEATQYDAKGTAVAPAHHDLQARVTFYYKFLKPQS